MTSNIDPEVKAYMDAMLEPCLERFATEMARKRSGGFDDDDIEDFVRDAVESFEEYHGAPLDPVTGPYVIAKLREAAELAAVD
jgi:hypothetical protein